jgi:hypothetical protein
MRKWRVVRRLGSGDLHVDPRKFWFRSSAQRWADGLNLTADGLGLFQLLASSLQGNRFYVVDVRTIQQ